MSRGSQGKPQSRLDRLMDAVFQQRESGIYVPNDVKRIDGMEVETQKPNFRFRGGSKRRSGITTQPPHIRKRIRRRHNAIAKQARKVNR